MKKFDYVFSWLPLAVGITLVSLMLYGVLQQSIRLSTNFPQVQMAEDAALLIVRGEPPQSVVPATTVDMATSLAPFMIVYDDRGNVMASSVVLDGKVPVLPVGVLDQAREQKTDRVTWQPKQGVRVAAVIVRYVGNTPGFVLAGQSLREVEKLEDTIFLDVVIGWAVTMAATLFISYLFRR